MKRTPLKRTGFKRKKKKSKRKKLENELDRVFSLLVRKLTFENYGSCAFGKITNPSCTGSIDHCFHFVRRGKKILRWNLAGSVGSCAPCNLKMEYWPARFLNWYIKVNGQAAFDWLCEQEKIIKKWEISELEEMLADYENQLAALS